MHAKSNFDLVSEMNTAFSNPKGDPHKINGQKLLKQCQNIASEFKELMAAFGIAVKIEFGERDASKEVDLDAIRDALCDIHVFAYGAHHFMGLNADEDMQEVVRCVMTRFCKDDAHWVATAKHYTELGVEFYSEGEYPQVCLKSSRDQGDGEYPKGKFLKALGYEQPTFWMPPKPEPMREYQVTEEDIVMNMAKLRAEYGSIIDRKTSDITRQVEAYRAKLELEAFGMSAFDPNKNNVDDLFQPKS